MQYQPLKPILYSLITIILMSELRENRIILPAIILNSVENDPFPAVLEPNAPGRSWIGSVYYADNPQTPAEVLLRVFITF